MRTNNELVSLYELEPEQVCWFFNGERTFKMKLIKVDGIYATVEIINKDGENDEAMIDASLKVSLKEI